MPAFSFIFNKLQVEIPAKKLSLSVDSSVSLQCSSGNAQPTTTRQLLDLLCSGKTWVTRGIGCRIDFFFLLDKQQDKEQAMEKIVKDFTAYVRDLPLWSQVSLAAELEFPERNTSGDLQPNFSIILRHPPFGGISGHSSILLSSAPLDVQIPTGVPCFQLRRIKIVMTFNFERAFQNPKPSLPCTEADGAKDWFEMKRGPGGESTSLTSYLLPQQAVFNSSHGAQYTSSLYPDTLLCQDHEMLDDDTFLYEMDIATPLLTTHSLTKRLSALPTPSDSQEEEIGHTPTDCSMTSMTSDLSCAREMAHLAFRKLVGGRQSKSRPGIKVISRRPTLTLPTLAPSLFSPGYAEAMSQRSRFIPTISHTLSVSLLRNAQSPSLRRKLLSLVSNPAQSPRNDVMVDPVDDIDDHSGRAGHRTSQALCRAVEARLWAMMQRSLYHPSSAWLVLPPEDVDASVHVGPTAGLVEMSIGGPEAAGHAIEESLSYTSCSQGFFEDEFEDLFEEVPDEGDYEEFEALFSDNQIERSIDDDFEDLLEGEPPDEPDQAAYAGVEEREMDFDIIVDDGIRYWENVQNINTGGVLGQYCIENPEISDIENEGMLI